MHVLFFVDVPGMDLWLNNKSLTI